MKSRCWHAMYIIYWNQTLHSCIHPLTAHIFLTLLYFRSFFCLNAVDNSNNLLLLRITLLSSKSISLRGEHWWKSFSQNSFDIKWIWAFHLHVFRTTIGLLSLQWLCEIKNWEVVGGRILLVSFSVSCRYFLCFIVLLLGRAMDAHHDLITLILY